MQTYGWILAVLLSLPGKLLGACVPCLFNKGPFDKAETFGAIGEVGNLYLAEDGLQFTPLANDFLGDTDKLMTGSIRLSALKSWQSSSLMLSAYWRSLTPIFQRRFGQENLARPIGSFADWAELQSSYARDLPLSLPWGKLKYQLTLSIGHMGDKGIKYIHRALHRLVNQSQDQLHYQRQAKAWTASFGHQFAYILQRPLTLLRTWYLKFSMGAYSSEVMLESYGGVNAYTSLWGNRLSVEGRLIRQYNSGLYSQVKPLRWEWAAGLKLSPKLSSAIKYISPYLVGDNVRQIYFDLTLHWTWP